MDDRVKVEEIANLIRRHVRLEWRGHDNADINPSSVTAAAEAIAARASDTGRSEAEAELRRHWHDFCDADPTPDGFVDRMEAAGLAEVRAVNRDDLEDPFASERGIYKGGSLWDLTPAGRALLNPPAGMGEPETPHPHARGRGHGDG